MMVRSCVKVSIASHLHRAWTNTNLDAVSASQNQVTCAFSSAHITSNDIRLGETLLQLLSGLYSMGRLVL